ncbi:flagellar hook-associated protein FlgK [Aliiroseovarius sp. F20344]|uniref:flagellar hook-associated protein FlgK n=1 Tax=Aliiroseovarius sp. F20344 TaxID=2926414 RepID=UPI001FF3BF41|nr:flagellar hook-associated protein FlgK [Aliiroseovarius sp. F20344]MCK0141478.1 flagellar hook-associated protein FlgK [Aliiroseovarius sp. F20344]
MTISGALHNALTGLNANTRAAHLVSNNVANAMTEGYGARSLELSSRNLGGAPSGVAVEGVRRNVDEILVGERRLSDAAIGHSSTRSGFLAGLEKALGTPDQPGSLSGRLAQFEAALTEAAVRPDSEAALNASLNAAKNVVSHIKATSDHIQAARLSADSAIAQEVGQLNQGLEDVQNLNVKIQAAMARGADPSGLMDQRQQAIDALSSIVPIKQVPRDGGRVALISAGGAILLDGKPAKLEFSTVNLIVPEMTQAGGALSGLTINGQSVDTSSNRSAISGGSLAAHFEVRDELAVTAQEQLDGFARNLVERFQDPALDATRAPGAPGLFTDAGLAFDPVDEVALSTRLTVNAAVDPSQGGVIWRLRDGLGAAVPGNVGNSQLLNDKIEVLNTPITAASGGFSSTARSTAGLAADLLNIVASGREQMDTRLSFDTAQNDSLRQMELSHGVDTDAEMQKLMMIEQAFAANAQVITTADEMMQLILGL